MLELIYSLFHKLKVSALPLGIEIFCVGLVFYFIEQIKPAEKNIPFIKSDTKTELAYGLLNGLIAIPLYAFLMTVLFFYIIEPFIPKYPLTPWIVSLPLVIQMLLGAFILDFSTYWRHRFTHRYMWPFHAIHHSAEHLNWLTTLRLHPIDIMIAVIFDFTLLHLAGFDGAGMVFAVIFFKAYNYFTHANLNVKFEKPLRYIFVSPHFHRWHHANEKHAYNKNYSSMFSCLDYIFGTYYHPEDRLPKIYGIDENDQKNFPTNFLGQLAYPIKKTFRALKK